MLAKTKMTMPTSKPLSYVFTTRKKYGVPSKNFVKKMFCAKKVTKLPNLTILMSRVSDLWSPVFSEKGSIDPACGQCSLYVQYSDFMVYI